MAIPKKYDREFAECGIDSDDFLTLLECADWILHKKRYRQELSDHLDLNDSYLDALAGKIHRFMNPEEDAT